MTKVLRLFVIEKHSFVARDFFRGYRENFKKSLAIGLLDILVVFSAYASYNVYPYYAIKNENNLFYIPMIITLSLALIVFMMNYYIFPMLVATDLSLKNLIKNSFALAVVAIKQNIISTVFVLAFALLMFIVFLYTPPLFLTENAVLNVNSMKKMAK